MSQPPSLAELPRSIPSPVNCGTLSACSSQRLGLHKPVLLIAGELASAAGCYYNIRYPGLFCGLSCELNMAMLFISPDLLSVATPCSQIAILQRGEIIEGGATGYVFRDPLNEDTPALLQAVLQNSIAGNEMVTRKIAAGKWPRRKSPRRR